MEKRNFRMGMWAGTERSPHLSSRGILMGWMSLFHTVPRRTVVAPAADPTLFHHHDASGMLRQKAAERQVITISFRAGIDQQPVTHRDATPGTIAGSTLAVGQQGGNTNHLGGAELPTSRPHPPPKQGAQHCRAHHEEPGQQCQQQDGQQALVHQRAVVPQVIGGLRRCGPPWFHG